jgi:MFS family permease
MFRSLSVRNYRLFASGQMVSLIGTWMQMTTQDWLVIALGGGGVELGVTLGLQFGPMLLIGLYGGVVADRVDKRRLLLATQMAYAVLASAMCLLVVTGAVTLPVVYVFAAAVGSVAAFDTPTRQAFVSEMVGADRLPNAVALNSITFNSARVVGPATAGLIIGAMGTMPGAALVFGVNAASYLATITSLLLMRTGELHRPKRPTEGKEGKESVAGAESTERAESTGSAGRDEGTLRQLRDGLRYVARHRAIAIPIMLVGVVGTLGLNFPVTLALMASKTFHGTAATYGMFTALLAAGGVLGAAMSARRRGPPRPSTLVFTAAAFGFFETLAGVMPTLPMFAATTVFVGAAVLMFTTTANTTVQLAAEPAIRGRVMAVYLLVFLGTTPIGAPIVGVVSAAAGARAGLALGGLSCMAAAATAAFAFRRSPRTPLQPDRHPVASRGELTPVHTIHPVHPVPAPDPRCRRTETAVEAAPERPPGRAPARALEGAVQERWADQLTVPPSRRCGATPPPPPKGGSPGEQVVEGRSADEVGVAEFGDADHVVGGLDEAGAFGCHLRCPHFPHAARVLAPHPPAFDDDPAAVSADGDERRVEAAAHPLVDKHGRPTRGKQGEGDRCGVGEPRRRHLDGVGANGEHLAAPSHGEIEDLCAPDRAGGCTEDGDLGDPAESGDAGLHMQGSRPGPAVERDDVRQVRLLGDVGDSTQGGGVRGGGTREKHMQSRRGGVTSHRVRAGRGHFDADRFKVVGQQGEEFAVGTGYPGLGGPGERFEWFGGEQADDIDSGFA